MPSRCRPAGPFIAALLVLSYGCAARAGQGVDQRRMDPPPATAEIHIPSAGDTLNGVIYLAGGPGPHPVVVFLHGYPGFGGNHDLAQAIRRAGHHALVFNYRGTWGTSGTFSFQNSLDDAASTVAWLRDPEQAAEHNLDPGRIALVGHSFGGWVALMHGSREPASVCVAALAAWNIGWAAKRFADFPEERKENFEYFHATTAPASGPVRGNADALVREMMDHADEWDYLDRAAALRGRAVFLAATPQDTPDGDATMHERLAATIAAGGGRSTRPLILDDDHSFSASRDALASALVRWLSSDCAAAQRLRAGPSVQ